MNPLKKNTTQKIQLYYVIKITFDNALHENIVSREVLALGSLSQALDVVREIYEYWISVPEVFEKLAMEINPCR